MKLPLTTKDKIENPLKGFGFAFIDEKDKKLKVKKHDSIIEFTNDFSDIQLLDLIDYTAFEVLPTTFDIPSGIIIRDSILNKNIIDEEILSSSIYKSIPSGTIQSLVIRTTQINPEMSDVIIDWGDGNISSINKNEYESSDIDVSKNEGDYTFSHDYKDSLLNENKEYKHYIIKIYGKQYYNIKQSINLMSRVFDIDLPIASHLGNISKFCLGSSRLVHSSLENIKYRYFENCEGLFRDCNNLIKVIGMGTNFTNAVCSNLFKGCNSLIYTDAKLALNGLRSSSISSCFYGCKNLSMKWSDLFPSTYQIHGSIDIQNLFNGCIKMTGNIPSDMLWNNKNVQWKNAANAFLNCSEATRSQVPKSWGGTALDDIIEQ